MEPITRTEKLMAGQQLEPITRKELFLAKAAGMDVETPEPITREEMFLNMMTGGGGGTPGGGGSSPEWFNDGDTHIWITLAEGRTSPMLACCPNGTVTVDWGDGTEPDVLTGTSTTSAKGTPNHNYASAGDYVISLSVDGEMGFINSSGSSLLMCNGSSDVRSKAYRSAVKKFETGNGITSIGHGAFDGCSSLASVTIPNVITRIGTKAFSDCRSLQSLTIPNSVTSIANYAFGGCNALASLTIPNSVTSIDDYAFNYCYGVRYYDFSAYTSVPTLGGTKAFNGIPDDCQMLIPSALFDEWSTATNWATYASYMVAV